MGDAADDVIRALKYAGLEVTNEYEGWGRDVIKALRTRVPMVTTLVGTTFAPEDDDPEEEPE